MPTGYRIAPGKIGNRQGMCPGSMPIRPRMFISHRNIKMIQSLGH